MVLKKNKFFLSCHDSLCVDSKKKTKKEQHQPSVCLASNPSIQTKKQENINSNFFRGGVQRKQNISLGNMS